MNRSFKCFLVLTIATLLFISCLSAGAKTISFEDYVSTNISNSMKDTSWNFIEFAPASEAIISQSAVTSSNSIIFPYAWMQSIIKFDDSAFPDLNKDDIVYESSNEDVAYVITQGGHRIYANGVGSATITIEYNGMVQYVNVFVEDELDEHTLDSLTPSVNASSVQTTATVQSVAAERTAIHNKAIAMKSISWTPTQNLIKWCDSSQTYVYFPSGTLQYGLPYTQSGYRCDETFFSSMYQNASTTGFYNIMSFTNISRVGPKFGADCASFVAAAWGLWYNPISATQPSNSNTYYWVPSFINGISNGTFTELNDYSELQTGDAVYISGHVFLITQNFVTPPSGSGYSESYVVAIEQKPYQTAYTFWTYSQLESEGYVPFSKF